MNKTVKIALMILVPTAVLAIGYVGWKLYKKEPIIPKSKKKEDDNNSELTEVKSAIKHKEEGKELNDEEKKIITESVKKATSGRG